MKVQIVVEVPMLPTECNFATSGRALNFAHIEKTAGTTLRYLLEDHFDHREVLLHHFRWLMSEKCVAREHRVFRHHVPEFLRKLGGSATGVDNITMLRDPVDRMASLYLHWIRDLNLIDIDLALSQKNVSPGLADYLRSGPSNSFTIHNARLMPRNYQTRWLAAAYASEPPDPWSEEPAQIEPAKRFLKSCRWLGLVENMRQALLALHLEFSWRPTNLDRRENEKGPGQIINLTEEDRQRLRSEHAIDDALYCWAAKETANRLRRAIDERVGELHSAVLDRSWADYKKLPSTMARGQEEADLFENCERAYLLRRLAARPACSTVVFDAASALVGDGWQRREYDEGGTVEPYRWSGPGPVSDIDLPLTAPRGGYFRLHVNAYQSRYSFKLSGFANGLAMGEPSIESSSEGGIVWTAEFPPTSSSLGFIRFSFEVPKIERLCDIAETPDRRSVGFSFRRAAACVYR
jgi:hypothetical protein